MSTNDPPVLVTGATGYVGGRLVSRLLSLGYRVRCLVRTPRKLESRTWVNHPNLEVVEGDLSDPSEISEKIRGCRSAYYLVHSMASAAGEFAERDSQLARNFSAAAKAAGLDRIIYLGGLGEMGDDLSRHLLSRREVEEALATDGVTVTTLRAAMIIGSGSASFEILRYLVERLPIMITPKWVETKCQPVSIRDVLHWLVESLNLPLGENRALEIGGSDVHSYRELMEITAEELKLPKRAIFGVPLLTPRLSSGWISLVTPVSYEIARPLAEGLRNRVVVGDAPAQDWMPHQPLSAREAIRLAISRTAQRDIETTWSAAGPIPGDPDWAGGTVFVDKRSIDIKADAAAVFKAICRVGGGHGWYAADVLWRIRGIMDQLVGGPGLRRGRRHPEDVAFGEALDFWRVVGIERNRLLHLHAEMKLPGTARLEFSLPHRDAPCQTNEAQAKHDQRSHVPIANDEAMRDHDRASTRLEMTARFRPQGLAGLMYWYSVLPLHHIVFRGMLNGIKAAAERDFEQEGQSPKRPKSGDNRPSETQAPDNDAQPHRSSASPSRTS